MKSAKVFEVSSKRVNRKKKILILIKYKIQMLNLIEIYLFDR